MKSTFLPAVIGIITFCSCNEEIIVPDAEPAETTAALELSMTTATLTRGLIKDTQLPDGASVGITVKDDYGVYTGELFTNIKYTAQQQSGNQVWVSDSPVMLSSETGTAYAYYP